MNPFFKYTSRSTGGTEQWQSCCGAGVYYYFTWMPYPKNVETAIAVENTVRANGAVPATIAIFNGKCHVGLTNEQLEYFGNAKNVWKVSLRDMPYVISKNLYGATTVAATMRIAAMAGIKIFVTGGIGGVHRDAPPLWIFLRTLPRWHKHLLLLFLPV